MNSFNLLFCTLILCVLFKVKSAVIDDITLDLPKKSLENLCYNSHVTTENIAFGKLDSNEVSTCQFQEGYYYVNNRTIYLKGTIYGGVQMPITKIENKCKLNSKTKITDIKLLVENINGNESSWEISKNVFSANEKFSFLGVRSKNTGNVILSNGDSLRKFEIHTSDRCIFYAYYNSFKTDKIAFVIDL